MEIPLEWYGPFVIVPQPGFDCVFEHSLASESGLYLWTIELDESYLINYVGETQRPFSVRIQELVQWSLSGWDGYVSIPEEFEQGRAALLAQFNFTEFLEDYPRLSSAIYRNYRSYRVFLAPTNVDGDTRKSIEAGIIRTLRGAGQDVAEFLCNKKLESPSPHPFNVYMEASVRFCGLDLIVLC